MVQRTKFGEVVEEEEGYTLNVKPFGQPLFLIFLQNNSNIISRLSALPKVFCGDLQQIKKLANHCYHIITICNQGNVPEVRFFVGQLDNISQVEKCSVGKRSIVAIDLLGNIKLPDNLFRLDLSGKSEDFAFEYLKEFLRVE